MTSLNDDTQPVYRIPPQGLNPGPMHILPPAQPYNPPPQVPVTGHVNAGQLINTEDVNPFTTKPIKTEWKTNELIMKDPHMRVTSRVSVQDLGQTQASNYVSPQHLQMGWNWCGGQKHCYMKSSKQAY